MVAQVDDTRPGVDCSWQFHCGRDSARGAVQSLKEGDELSLLAKR